MNSTGRTNTVLDDIIVGVRKDLEERKAAKPFEQLKEEVSGITKAAQDPLPRFRSDDLAVISEVKRSSPSKGALADIPEPAKLATAYQAGGAAAISVLTEKHRFNGTLEDLAAVRKAVTIPVLRKDFMVDPYQFYEARLYGADLVLLIVAALTDEQLHEFYDLARELTMTPLVEVHTPEEVERANALGADLIGVNNRNLKTLDVDLAQFSRLVGSVRDDAVKVAESGILSPADAQRVADEGADVILVGEALVRSGEPTEAVKKMIVRRS